MAGLAFLAPLAYWFGGMGLLALVGLVWAWNIRDAYQLAQGRASRIWLPVILGAIVIYAMGVQVTQVRLDRLVTGLPGMWPFVKALTEPELFEYPTEDKIGVEPIQVPCIDPLPEPDRLPTEDPDVILSVKCASVGDTIQVSGEGFFPDFEGNIWWINPIGSEQRILENRQPLVFTTDDQGHFEVSIVVPMSVSISNLPGPGETQTHRVQVVQHRPYGLPQPTETLRLVIRKIGETVALAFLATVLGVIFALPVSFLAARNLMFGHPITRVIYYMVRGTLNIVRSIETLMWAIIFAVWVGLGPFGGMIALWLHTVAALGKLYSEAIESIEPGPIEAIRATGARWPQMVSFAVIPQILPSFVAYTLYRWDINVRMSTVIGLVSDAGLGFLVIQWIRLNQFRAMATAIIAIVLVVAILDWVSGKVRQGIIEGKPAATNERKMRRRIVRLGLVGAFILAFIWSWNVAEVDLPELVKGAPDGLRIARAFASPDLIDRPTEQRSVSQLLPVPCGIAENEPQVSSGPRVSLSLDCGDVGDPLTIIGSELPPDTDVSIRWSLPDGAYLRVQANCCTTDAAGSVQLDATISPLMEISPEDAANGAGSVVIVWEEVVGGPQISENAKIVLNLALQTLLIALIATTIGTFFAIPLSFLAARNVMGGSRIGMSIYTFMRMCFNVFRSIEPLILVLIAAAWVGAGPFAGVIALALNNIPNLGKLFSETIEDVDEGPMQAVTSTGANRLQVLVYALVPQIVPPFLAFILYQWDINIRMSTVLGFVGGGGIGEQFRIWVGLNQYAAAGAATLAIVLMVWSMDYLSAKAREKLV